MTPEVTSAIALLEAKVKMIAEHEPTFVELILPLRPLGSRLTVELLREIDQHAESGLRYAVPKEMQAEMRAKLIAEFGRSTLGELFEDAAKRILARGKVANREEF